MGGRRYQLLVELFVVFNFAGLSADIFLAHSENHFRRAAEYIPLYFSIASTVVLAIVVACRRRWPAMWLDVGYFIGWLAIVIGIVGVVLHLDSRFFFERTIRSLTYAAPFAAPLAYTGLGLLLVANRMVDPDSLEWAQWMLLLALGGFVGNFVFSLTDHAQNGFFNRAEWIPVVSSAMAIGLLVVPFISRVTSSYLWLCVGGLALQALAGVLGVFLHARATLERPAASLFDRIIDGPPALAPLLFPNLVVLGLIALAAMWPSITTASDPA